MGSSRADSSSPTGSAPLMRISPLSRLASSLAAAVRQSGKADGIATFASRVGAIVEYEGTGAGGGDAAAEALHLGVVEDLVARPVAVGS